MFVNTKDLRRDDRVLIKGNVYGVRRVTTTGNVSSVQWSTQGRPFLRSGSSETLMEVVERDGNKT